MKGTLKQWLTVILGKKVLAAIAAAIIGLLIDHGVLDGALRGAGTEVLLGLFVWLLNSLSLV